jgi:hypothetical protein
MGRVLGPDLRVLILLEYPGVSPRGSFGPPRPLSPWLYQGRPSARPDLFHHGFTKEPLGLTPGYSSSIRTLRSGPNTEYGGLGDDVQQHVHGFSGFKVSDLRQDPCALPLRVGVVPPASGIPGRCVFRRSYARRKSALPGYTRSTRRRLGRCSSCLRPNAPRPGGQELHAPEAGGLTALHN